MTRFQGKVLTIGEGGDSHCPQNDMVYRFANGYVQWIHRHGVSCLNSAVYPLYIAVDLMQVPSYSIIDLAVFPFVVDYCLKTDRLLER